ncbi:thermonuclease family protein [Aerococcaceae bacterium WGS1372]
MKKTSTKKGQHTKRKNKEYNKNLIITGVIILSLWIFFPDLLDFDYHQGTINYEESILIEEEFNGNNFEVLPKQKKIPVEVVSVNDGDTIKVRLNNHKFAVRYLMINAPEMNYNEGSPEQYAVEAKLANENYLFEAEQVYIELDVGPSTDNYNRVLAYVYADEVLLNERLVEEGLADVRYINPPNNSYEELLKQAQKKAEQNAINIWE